MLRIRLTSALLITGALVAAAPAAANASSVFAGSSAAAVQGKRIGPASASHRLTLLLSLRTDEAALTAYATAVSNPASPLFGKYLRTAQITKRFGSSKADRARVTKALRAKGLPARPGASGLWIETEATVAQASALFSTGFASYRARTSGKRFVAPTGKPQLPPALAGTVTGVIGLDDAPAFTPGGGLGPLTPQETLSFNSSQRAVGSSMRGNLGTRAGCSDARTTGQNVPIGSSSPNGYIPAYTPNQINTAYGLDTLHKRGYKGQGQRIAVIETDGFDRSDLLTAAECFGYKAPPTPVKLVGINQPLPAGTETTLDLQVLAVSAPKLNAISVYEGDGSNPGIAKSFEAAITAQGRYTPSVISSSLGICEAGQASAQPLIDAMEQLFKAAAARGITVASDAGDTGATGCPIGDNSDAFPVLSLQYPSSSPWVTGVGGTNFSLNSANKITEEVVWNDSPTNFGAGGGGYSLLFRKPWWQKGPGVGSGQAVRNSPDIALLADSVPGYPIYCADSDCLDGWSPVGGTSASTPLFAAGMAIANQQAKAEGQSQVGFLNPAIYKLAAKSSTRKKVFRDVTTLGNDLGKMIAPAFAASGCCSAAKYYDRASGWGSVNFPSFSYEVRKLRSHRPSAVTGGHKR